MQEGAISAVAGDLAGKLNESSDKTITSSVLGGTAGAGSEYKGDPADVSDFTVSLSTNLDSSGGVVNGMKSEPFGSSDSVGTPMLSTLLLWWFTVGMVSRRLKEVVSISVLF